MTLTVRFAADQLQARPTASDGRGPGQRCGPSIRQLTGDHGNRRYQQLPSSARSPARVRSDGQRTRGWPGPRTP